MISAVRRAARTILPRRTHQLLDGPVTLNGSESEAAAVYERIVQSQADPADLFVRQRFFEGLRWSRVLEGYLSDRRGSHRVLDVGAGNGAVELAFAARNPEIRPASVEYTWNADAINLHREAGIPLRRTCASADALPFRSESFDAVACLETMEHFINSKACCSEIARVVRRGGVILLTTPPRWRYALRRDPHFGIRGLVLLPPRFQRLMAARRGHNAPQEYVDRIYSSVPQIAKMFEGCEVETVLSRSRAPQRWFWDAIVLRRRKE